MVPLDPADAATSAASLLRDAEVVVQWREEEQTDYDPDLGDPQQSHVADSHAAGSDSRSSTDAAPGLEVHFPPGFRVPPPLPLPEELPLPDESPPGLPPCAAREAPLGLSELHLPLYGMLQLRDGSTQVIDQQWTFRAVACLLQIREKQAKRVISTASGGAVSPAAAVVPVDFVMPNDGITECHRELQELYASAIRQNWEAKHGRPFVVYSKNEPNGCKIRPACPFILTLCQHHIAHASHGCQLDPRHCVFTFWPRFVIGASHRACKSWLPA